MLTYRLEENEVRKKNGKRRGKSRERLRGGKRKKKGDGEEGRGMERKRLCQDRPPAAVKTGRP